MKSHLSYDLNDHSFISVLDPTASSPGKDQCHSVYVPISTLK